MTGGKPIDDPVSAISRAPRRRLPVQPTRLIGREPELAQLRAHLLDDDTRLLTITGPGGSGKTRLALSATAAHTARVAHDAVFVELAPLRDASTVIVAIADALEVQDVGARPLFDAVVAELQSGPLLLVLDNFEHVRAAAPMVAALLEVCPQLRILATSREPLHLRWERRFPLAPLALPTDWEASDPERLAGVPACALFVERARAVKPDFSLTAANAASVASICARLDGLPLAIELAAARTNVLAPDALMGRLEHRLDLRTTELDRPDRHRGLRQTIDWSYALLQSNEQQLFRRLAVFAGSATLDAISAVCADDQRDADVLDRLSALVDQGLLHLGQADGAEPRFAMLETIREFAWEQLDASGELLALRARHARFYGALVRRMEAAWWGPHMLAWADHLESALPNLRAALAWSLEPVADAGDGLDIVSFPYFWDLRGHLGEARDWLARLLAAPNAQTPTVQRARGLAAAAYFALMNGDLDAAMEWVQAAVPLARAHGEPGTVWLAVASLGQTLRHREVAAAEPYLREAYAIARAAQYPAGLVGSPFMLGDCRRALGDLDGARRLFEECVATSRALEVPFGSAWAQRGLAHLDWMAGKYAASEEHLTEALRVAGRIRFARAIADVLEVMAWNAASWGRAERAARLLGAGQRVRDSLGIGIQGGHLPAHEAAVRAAHARLGGSGYDRAFRGGYATARADTIEWAIAPDDDPASGPDPRSRLTTRECEVVRLLAQNYSNREIAQALVIAERTAETHVTNILTKLGFTSRVQVGPWAAVNGLSPPPPARAPEDT